MNCPKCKMPTEVIDTRISSCGSYVRRRRECEICSFRMTTYERDKGNEKHKVLERTLRAIKASCSKAFEDLGVMIHE